MKKGFFFSLGILLVLGVVSAVSAQKYDERFLPNVSIGNIDVSGMTVPEAEDVLLRNFDALLKKQVSVEVNGKQYAFTYEELGADIDVYRTLNAAYEYGHFQDALANYSDRLTALFSRKEFAPILYSDTEFAANAIATRTGADNADVAALLESAAAADGLKENLYASTLNVELFRKKVVTIGKVIDGEIPDPVAAFPVKSVKLVVDNEFTPYQSWEIFFNDPDWFDITTAKDGTYKAQLSEVKVSEFLRKHIIPKVEVAPENAVVRSIPEEGVGYAVTEGRVRPGVQMPLEVNVRRVMTFVPQQVPRIYLGTVRIPGKILNQTGKDLGDLELLAVGRSNFKTSPEGRAFNIRKGIKEHVNNVLIPPGETYSFNKQLGGPITNAGGWKDSLAIFGGTTLRPVPGGGLCQVSTTVYRAFLNAGLPMVKRYPHSLYVHYYAEYGEGLDATIYPGQKGGKDLQVLNDTPDYVLVQAYTEGDDAFVEVYGTSDGREVALHGPYRNGEVPKEHGSKQYSSKTIVWFQNIKRPDGIVETNEIISTYVKPIPRKAMHAAY